MYNIMLKRHNHYIILLCNSIRIIVTIQLYSESNGILCPRGWQCGPTYHSSTCKYFNKKCTIYRMSDSHNYEIQLTQHRSAEIHAPTIPKSSGLRSKFNLKKVRSQLNIHTGCTHDTAFHDRRPSVPRHCGKNLEQSAIRSDVFAVSANV